MANELATFAITGGSLPGPTSPAMGAGAGVATTSGRAIAFGLQTNAAGQYVATVQIVDQAGQDRSFVVAPFSGTQATAVLSALLTWIQTEGQALVTSQAPGATITFTGG